MLEAAQFLIKGSETKEQQLTLMGDCSGLSLSLLPLVRVVEDGLSEFRTGFAEDVQYPLPNHERNATSHFSKEHSQYSSDDRILIECQKLTLETEQNLANTNL
jgi:hypothetical protein